MGTQPSANVSVGDAMRALPSLAVAALTIAGVWFYFKGPIGCGAMESGGTLYLNRLGVETPRASFCYAPDCRLVAEQMTRAENANWYCR